MIVGRSREESPQSLGFLGHLVACHRPDRDARPERDDRAPASVRHGPCPGDGAIDRERRQEVPVCRGGLAADFSEADLTEKLRAPECHVRFTIRGKGRGRVRFWTCDLTEGYIQINGSYRT